MDQNRDNRQQGSDRQSQNPNRDQAEGSRENVRSGHEGQSQSEGPGGISNRPLDREEEQRDLPRRGETRDQDKR